MFASSRWSSHAALTSLLYGSVRHPGSGLFKNVAEISSDPPLPSAWLLKVPSGEEEAAAAAAADEEGGGGDEEEEEDEEEDEEDAAATETPPEEPPPEPPAQTWPTA